MKTILATVALLLSISACRNETTQKGTSTISNAQSNTTMNNQSEVTAIEKSLAIYFDALNKSSVQQAVGQYTSDGVFMPTGLPTASGTRELNIAYENVFKALQLNVTFKVEEVVFLGENVAFVRTQSNGTQLIHVNGQTTEELNREFFLLRKENGGWKISRYMFNQPK